MTTCTLCGGQAAIERWSPLTEALTCEYCGVYIKLLDEAGSYSRQYRIRAP